MPYQHFVIIRFSIKMKRSTGFYNPIKKWNYERLNYRFFLFENICLPSLISQKNKKNYKIILMISNDLPDKFKLRLRNITKQYDFIHIVPVDEIQWQLGDFLKSYCPEDTEYIVTTRMDDDDALNCNFTELVASYVGKDNYNDYFISFPYGFYLNMDRKKRRINYFPNKNRLIACGLTRIRKYDLSGTAYCGAHKQLEKRGFKVIYGSTKGMYSVTNHKYNDSTRIHFINHKNSIPVDAAYKNIFPFIDETKLLFGKI